MNKLSSALLAAIAGGALLLAASPAGASTTKGARPAASASPHIPFNLPAGYTVVTSLFAAPDGTQTHGFVSCPGTEVPSGGGAVIQSSALEANLNSSYPAGQGWAVDVNNTGGLQTTVTVYAVCIKASSTYSVVSSTIGEGPTGTQYNSAYCPAHTVVTGGGVLSSSLSTGVNINSTYPGNGNDWVAIMTNSTSAYPNFTVYAICRSKPTGYHIQGAAPTTVQPGGEASATVACPGTSAPIGGGGFTSSPGTDTAVGMNTTYPNGYSWTVYENNSEPVSRLLNAEVVCAGS